MVTPTPTITVKPISKNFVEPAADPHAVPAKGPNSIDIELETKSGGTAASLWVIVAMPEQDCFVVADDGNTVDWADTTNYKGFRMKSDPQGSLKFSFFGRSEAIIELHIYPEGYPDAQPTG